MAVPSSGTDSPRAAGPELAPRHAEWLEAVDPLILSAERRAFLALNSGYQRDAFIDRFWRERDPHPETPRNEYRERYQERVHQARALYRRLDDDRARIFMVHGPPASRSAIKCSPRYNRAEIWHYQGSEQISYSILLVFLRSEEEPARLWHPNAEGADNAIGAAGRCIGGEQVELAAAAIRSEGLDWELGFQRLIARPRPRNGEWLATFTAFTTDLPLDAKTFDAVVELDYPGRYRQRTVVQGHLALPAAALGVGDLLGFRSYDVELTGEIVLRDRLFENFRYKFSFAADSVEGGTLPLAFHRYLRPGEYRLIVKLEDLNGGSFARVERRLEVPRLAERFVPATAPDSETARLFAEATAAVSRGETSIQIVQPRSQLQVGFVRFDTLAVGDDIAKVAFVLDDRLLATKNRPPFNVEIDLGDYPRPHTLRVEALDEAGLVVARDEIRINAGTHRFAVRLVEPRRGVAYERSLLAKARVEVPEGESLERLELFLNDRLVATLFQPPFAQPVALPRDQELTYVRAVAHLADGQSAEDLVFVNEPDNLERIDVQMVELYTTVLDAAGRPVSGLEAADFAVFEDGKRQQVVEFAAVADRAIHAGILFDNSASMAPALDQARLAALAFFRQAIRPQDRAAIITFNRLPTLAVGLTSDLRVLGGGLAGLTAEGETALYDSIMFGLYYLAGVKGQRALLVLSDGKDETSRFSFDETLEYARRAGVTLYAVGLGLGEPVHRERLGRLADETGGRAFFIDDLGLLVEVYSIIQQELRSQYLLTYQSSQADGGESFRTIEVELARQGLTAKTLSGYYP